MTTATATEPVARTPTARRPGTPAPEAGERAGPWGRTQTALERLVERHGATDFVLLEDSISPSVSFALRGHYVQFVLPLPDRLSRQFTHTATGRPRALTAQERAYEQAVRRGWRMLLLVVQGKLAAVESGISTFEREFPQASIEVLGAGAGVRASAGRETRRVRRLLSVRSQSFALAVAAGLLLPVTALGALALPTGAVRGIAAPFAATQPDIFAEATTRAAPRSVADEAMLVALGPGERHESHGEAGVVDETAIEVARAAGRPRSAGSSLAASGVAAAQADDAAGDAGVPVPPLVDLVETTEAPTAPAAPASEIPAATDAAFAPPAGPASSTGASHADSGSGHSAAKPAEPTNSAEGSKSAEPAKSPERVKPGKSSDSAKPSPPAKSAEAAKPEKSKAGSGQATGGKPVKAPTPETPAADAAGGSTVAQPPGSDTSVAPAPGPEAPASGGSAEAAPSDKGSKAEKASDKDEAEGKGKNKGREKSKGGRRP
jgi:hypothetical protein